MKLRAYVQRHHHRAALLRENLFQFERSRGKAAQKELE